MQQKRKIFALATPSLGVVSVPWWLAIQNLMWPLNCTKTILPFMDRVGGEIAEGRNAIVDMAFKICNETQEVTHLFWVDDDVIVTPSCFLRLLSHNADVAAGVYFTKTEIGEPLIFPGAGQGVAPFVPDSVFEGWGWSMGLSVIKLDVFRRVRDELKLPLDKYGHTQFFKTPGDEDMKYVDGILTMGGTEDFPFFEHCEKIGVKPIIDCSCWAFGFHMDLKTLEAYPRQQWEQFKTGQAVTWGVGSKQVRWEQGVTERPKAPAQEMGIQAVTKEPTNASQEPSPASVPECNQGA